MSGIIAAEWIHLLDGIKDDHLGEAYIALARAAEKYDPEQGDFEPYARKWIWGAVKRQKREDRPQFRDPLPDNL